VTRAASSARRPRCGSTSCRWTTRSRSPGPARKRSPRHHIHVLVGQRHRHHDHRPRVAAGVGGAVCAERYPNSRQHRRASVPRPRQPQRHRPRHLHRRQPAAANAAMDGLVFTPDPNYKRDGLLQRLGPGPFRRLLLPRDRVHLVRITVTPLNDAPVAMDDNYAVPAGVPFVTAPYSLRREHPGGAVERPRPGMGPAHRDARDRPGARHLGAQLGRQFHLHRGGHVHGDRHVHLPPPSTPNSRATWRR